MVIMAREVAEKVESEMEYPGQIKVNVIRETRAIDYANKMKNRRKSDGFSCI